MSARDRRAARRAHLRRIASLGGQAKAEKDRAEKAAQLPPRPFAGSILDAMDAAGMTGASWTAWRVVAKAIHALPLDGGELEIFTRHTGRTTRPAEPVTSATLIVGRRGGKSRFDALSALYAGIRRDYRAILAPGEQATIPIIAADKKQARTVLRYLRGLCDLPGFKPYVVGVLKESIELTTGATVEVHTASYRTVRGYTVAGAVCDEIAFWATNTEDAAEPDSEIIDALTPGMATLPDALLLVSSTPYARRGVLFENWERHYGRDDSDTLIWVADSRSMNPSLSPKVVQRAYDDDAVAAASEFGAEGTVSFRSDVAGFVEREAVEAVTVAGRLELPRLAGIYVAFVDPAGGSGSDSFTLAIAHRDRDGHAILDCVRELRPRFSPDAATAELAATVKHYGITKVTGDHYAGEWPAERFAVHGLKYEASERTKSDLYRELLPILNAARCELLDLPRLRAQLVGLERRVARSGKDSIDHGPGQHDDVCNAVAGALVLVAGGGHKGPRVIAGFGSGPGLAPVVYDTWAEPKELPADWQPPPELDEDGNP